MTPKKSFLLILTLFWSCSLWEYKDPSAPVDNQAPDTYLSLIASDTLYQTVSDSDIVWAIIDSIRFDSVSQIYDTVWTYLSGDTSDSNAVWIPVEDAFETVTTSRQELHWWGEDPDGYVIGYNYRWNTDSAWTFTTGESKLFYVPIKTDLDIFSFEIVAVDDDSLIDPSPAKIVLPIRNSTPKITFRYRSNPLVEDLPNDTSFTFPTRTFIWDVEDQDGIETVTDIFYALDDTCETCWNQLDAAFYSSITLKNISLGLHTFFVKTRDIAGAESEVIQFPDIDDPTTANFWKVMPVVGDVLLVDDFPQDSQNSGINWYTSVLDSIIGYGNYSVWEIGDELPFSTTDINANLNYFKHVFWFSAYTGNETYNDASSSILNFVMKGGNIFLSAAEMKDTSFTWLPIDSTFWLNRRFGRLGPNRILYSQIDSTLNLFIDRPISVRVKGFEIFDSAPTYRSLYRLPEPINQFDEWEGTPNVCGIYQFQEPAPSGKVVYLSLPMHDGYVPLLNGYGNFGKFIKYLLEEEFVP